MFLLFRKEFFCPFGRIANRRMQWVMGSRLRINLLPLALECFAGFCCEGFDFFLAEGYISRGGFALGFSAMEG